MASPKTMFESVRRYCLERIALWSNRQGELDRDGAATVDEAYTEEALALFPRSEVMRALLRRIDELTPEDFESPSELARIFAEVAQNVTVGFSPPFCQDLEKSAAEAECALFLEYLGGLGPTPSWPSPQNH